MTGIPLVTLIIKSSLILGISVLMTLLAGQRWPEQCSLWKRVAIVALLVLPVAMAFFPSISIPLLPAFAEIELEAPKQTDEFAAATLTGSDRSENLDIKSFPSNTAGTLSMSPHHARSNRAAADASPAFLCSLRSSESVIWIVVAVVYACPVTLLCVRLIRSLRRLEQLRTTGTALSDPDWSSRIAKWTRLLRVRRQVTVRITDQTIVPQTFGWLSPVILIPTRCVLNTNSSQREAILIHELTHIANYDFFWKVLTQFMTAFYWPHPLAWLVRRDGDILRERLCDRYCTHQLGWQTYATALIEVARLAADSRNLRRTGTMGIAMAHHSTIRRRLDELACLPPGHHPRSGAIKQFLALGLATVASGLIVIGMLTARTGSYPDSSQNKTLQSVAGSEWADFGEKLQRKCEIAPTAIETGPPSQAAPEHFWPDDTEAFNAEVAATVNGVPIPNQAILDRYSGYLISVRDQMQAAADRPLRHGDAIPSIDDFHQLRRSLIQRDISTQLQKVILVQSARTRLEPEQFQRMEAHANEQFEQQIEILKRDHGVDTLQDLEHSLMSKGTTLARIRDHFVQERISTEYLVAMVDGPTSIDVAEVRAAYEANSRSYDVPGVAWWRELRVARSLEDGDKAARDMLARLSAEIDQLDDAVVDEVIRRNSNSRAVQYSSNNRAEQGSKRDQELEGQLFALPINRWSEVISQPGYICLICVSKRIEPRRQPLEEVQEEIRKTLAENKRLDRLRSKLQTILATAQIETDYELEGPLKGATARSQ
ncbi:M56 family metallopeptidase [Schlesneria sp. T3-172]|uniref:M56 family metallopeptidase n=1 Tax=Schlesneria sphaerica TaxID=3373610 RepID=UPI0037C7E9AD